jgi:ubiquinone/menaquinone biosynthesis C-methylase UbiE
MIASVAKDLSRRVYVATRTARAAAMKAGYVAYQMTYGRPAPSTAEAVASLRRRLEGLFEQDWVDAQAGYYPKDLLDGLPWREYADVLPKLFADLPRTRTRILKGRHVDLDHRAAPERYPHYYQRNFHWQSEGYLGHRSAELYDLQVEFLFGGTADVMRRRLIPPIVDYARALGHSRSRPLKILDAACGTGHLLRMMGAALPDAQLVGVDMSPHYVSRARTLLPRELNVSLLAENAEALPFVSDHFDAATCVFLLHELPADVRDNVIGEMARVVRPGGLVVIGDSLQLHDAPELERELRAFPEDFHEPYYLSYVRDDIAARMKKAGLTVVSDRAHFLTKVVVAKKEAQS